jgi:(E)-4-hydroxy-3-methylbut-2-enyl-diphosphate synthase
MDREAAFRAAGVPVIVSLLGSDTGSLLKQYRSLAAGLASRDSQAPIHIHAPAQASEEETVLQSSVLIGSLLCDGIGDSAQIDSDLDGRRGLELLYNVLQASGVRVVKAEFVSCPSCGRTLFDLQSTTERIRSQTGHLKGVKIAIMGCIVNGPGEMADADFGYVGGSPGTVNLYTGKEMVERGIPSEQAGDRLIALIKQNGKWVDP